MRKSPPLHPLLHRLASKSAGRVRTVKLASRPGQQAGGNDNARGIHSLPPRHSSRRRRATAGALAWAEAGPRQGAELNTPALYYYRFKLGDAEATIVSDGTLPLGDPHASFSGLAPTELDQQLTENFLPLKDAVLEQNILILNTGDRIVVFDTGMGSSKLFGNTTGKMMANVRQAGIDPASVDAVVMSHAHIDHCGGCMAEDGIRNFPNAQYYITQSDYDYRTDEKTVPAQYKAFLDQARKNLVPNRDRTVFIKDGQEFLPGVQAIAAPGHTIGHEIFMISSGDPRLWGRPANGAAVEAPMSTHSSPCGEE